MPEKTKMDRATTVANLPAIGSIAYESCVTALSVNEEFARSLLLGVLSAVGLNFQTVTMEELAGLAGVFERRCRTVLGADIGHRVVRDMQRFLLTG